MMEIFTEVIYKFIQENKGIKSPRVTHKEGQSQVGTQTSETEKKGSYDFYLYLWAGQKISTRPNPTEPQLSVRLV